MKNTLCGALLTAMAAIITLPADAQIYKGATFIGGNLGMSQKTVQTNGTMPGSDNSYFSAFVTPKAACYVTDNLAIGLSLHFGVANGEYGQADPLFGYVYTDHRTYTAGGSAFARYTKFIIPKFAFFTEGSIGYMHTRDRAETSYYPAYQNGEGRGNGYNVTITPGILFMPTPRFGFEATYGRLGYNYMRYKEQYPLMGPAIPAPVSTVSEFGFDLTSSTLTIGFNYYFGNRPRVKVEVSDED